MHSHAGGVGEVPVPIDRDVDQGLVRIAAPRPLVGAHRRPAVERGRPAAENCSPGALLPRERAGVLHGHTRVYRDPRDRVIPLCGERSGLATMEG
ncbi:Lipase [Nocardioides sp. PD653-B2]|nr:Lipase [Nocardioides sp. PD653-B2]